MSVDLARLELKSNVPYLEDIYYSYKKCVAHHVLMQCS